MTLEKFAKSLEPTQSFIDVDNADLHDMGVIANTKKISRNVAMEYKDETHIMILKSTISNLAIIIENIDDKSNIYGLMAIFKNIIILNADILAKNIKIMDSIHKIVETADLTHYNKNIIHKMLYNIQDNKSIDNIHFREINISLKKLPPIPIEKRIIMETKLPHFRYTRQFRKDPPLFKVDQIVGARDSENKWWLSRVLQVYTDPQSNHYWYYIHFEGFDAMHREWINSKTYRVRTFNSQKHFLKRI